MFASHRKITVVALLATALLASHSTFARACPLGGRSGGYRGGSRRPSMSSLYGRNQAKPRYAHPVETAVVAVVAKPPARAIRPAAPFAQVAKPVAVEAPVAVADLQFVELRLVDAADSVLELGPTYRVVVRNAGDADVSAPFQVTLSIAKNDPRSADAIRSTEEVASLAAGESHSVSFSLPYGAALEADAANVLVQVDSQRDVLESDEANNLAEVNPSQVDLIDANESVDVRPAGNAASRLAGR
jgi:hypothetical protein